MPRTCSVSQPLCQLPAFGKSGPWCDAARPECANTTWSVIDMANRCRIVLGAKQLATASYQRPSLGQQPHASAGAAAGELLQDAVGQAAMT